MKILCLAFLLLSSTTSVYTQTYKSPFEVVQKKWRYVLRNPALGEDPFQANDEQRQIEQERIDNTIQNKERLKLNLPPQPPPTHVRSQEELVKSTLPISTKFIYELKIKNTSEKKIQAVAWDYIFFDIDGKTELGRKQFVSRSNVNAGEAKTFINESTTPPTGIVNAAVSGDKLSKQYQEKIVIQRIIYSDNSVWNPSSN